MICLGWNWQNTMALYHFLNRVFHLYLNIYIEADYDKRINYSAT